MRRTRLLLAAALLCAAALMSQRVGVAAAHPSSPRPTSAPPPRAPPREAPWAPGRAAVAAAHPLDAPFRAVVHLKTPPLDDTTQNSQNSQNSSGGGRRASSRGHALAAALASAVCGGLRPPVGTPPPPRGVGNASALAPEALQSPPGAAADDASLAEALACARHLRPMPCTHVFASAFPGFSGTFQPSQLRALHACSPQLLLLVEHDDVVSLASSAQPQQQPTSSDHRFVRAADFDAPVETDGGWSPSSEGGAAQAAGGASDGGGATGAPPAPPLLPTFAAPGGVVWNLDRIDQRMCVCVRMRCSEKKSRNSRAVQNAPRRKFRYGRRRRCGCDHRRG